VACGAVPSVLGFFRIAIIHNTGAAPVITSMNGRIVGSLLSAALLTGCVSQSSYDALKAQNQQLEQKVAAQSADITRLQGAIKYVANSDLLFPSGGWELTGPGKQVIAGFAAKLAPTQQNKLLVNGYTDNTPIGPGLKQKGVTSNLMLSQRRAENVMQFLVSQGLKPELVAAQGFGDANPVASNSTAKGRAENRRVELTLAGSGS
jgi:chemotaxis protein MotB